MVGRSGDLISYELICIVRPDGQVVAQAAEGHKGIALFDLI